MTVDSTYCLASMTNLMTGKLSPPLSQLKSGVSKRGFLAFTFDGQYKFARYYAPDAFNAPKTMEQIFKYNDVQLFDLKADPNETHNLALDQDANKDTILRMNALLNDLMAKEVGSNNGAFLPESIRPKGAVSF